MNRLLLPALLGAILITSLANAEDEEDYDWRWWVEEEKNSNVYAVVVDASSLRSEVVIFKAVCKLAFLDGEGNIVSFENIEVPGPIRSGSRNSIEKIRADGVISIRGVDGEAHVGREIAALSPEIEVVRRPPEER